MIPFEDEMKKVFLAGIGAVATTVEKSQELVNDFVNKGKITVEQGKVLNEELKHNFKEAVDNTKKAATEQKAESEKENLLDQLDSLSEEQLEELKTKLSEMEKDGE